MASPLRLTVPRHPERGEAWSRDAETAWAAVRAEFGVCEDEMSRFRDTSDITALNRLAGSGDAVPVPRRLRRALVATDRAHRVTDGRFDPRVLNDLDRLGYAGAAIGDGPADAGGADAAAADAARRSGTRVVAASCRDGIRIDEPIDLGGIGKGLALRWSADAVERAGIGRYLLEAGGDLVARGPAPEGGPWLVGIEDPAGADDPLAAIAVQTGAVATSSVRINRWVRDGQTVHHLLDPRTGKPAAGGLQSVTVHGPDPAWAEIWSKALFVAGAACIAGEARRRGLAAWWVSDDGRIEMTAAARAMTTWVAGEA